jgi:hypothetical protein
MMEDTKREPTTGILPMPRMHSTVLGHIARVSSTREGRLVLVVGTDDGEVELHGTRWTHAFHGDDALPLGDLWHYVGSDAVVNWVPEGRLRAIESITIR